MFSSSNSFSTPYSLSERRLVTYALSKVIFKLSYTVPFLLSSSIFIIYSFLSIEGFELGCLSTIILYCLKSPPY